MKQGACESQRCRACAVTMGGVFMRGPVRAGRCIHKRADRQRMLNQREEHVQAQVARQHASHRCDRR